MQTANVIQFIEENLKTIFAYSLSRVSNKEDAEDLTNDIVLAILQSADKLKTPEAFYGHVWGIAANTYRKFMRKRSKSEKEIHVEALQSAEGTIICSDFHPFTKITDILKLEQPSMSYFSTEIFEGEMAHARFYEKEIRTQMPKCLYRKYTISEIINSVISTGFTLEKFDEHPAWDNDKLPGEFTIVAIKKLRS